MSLQERAQKAGFQSAFFTLQYRAVPQIAALYNQACYLNQLVDHETTFLPNEKRSLARQVVAHNHDKYGIGNTCTSTRYCGWSTTKRLSYPTRSAASHVKLWHTTTASMALGILALLQDIAADLHHELPQGIEYEMRSHGAFPHIRILSDNSAEALTSRRLRSHRRKAAHSSPRPLQHQSSRSH